MTESTTPEGEMDEQKQKLASLLFNAEDPHVLLVDVTKREPIRLPLRTSRDEWEVWTGYHVESVYRYLFDPPENPNWRFHSIHPNMLAATEASAEDVKQRIVPSPAPRNLSQKDRWRILKRDGYRCKLCGRTAEDGTVLEVDHKIPLSKGGSNKRSNLWTLCKECNRGKGTDLLKDSDDGEHDAGE